MQKLKKADIILIAAVATVSAALFFCGMIASGVQGGDTGSSGRQAFAEVLVDGEVYGRYDLSTDGSYEIVTDYGRNVLTVSGGTAAVTEADCAGGDCMRMKAVSRSGEMIVCLPHRVVVNVVSGEKTEIDVMVR